jgi:hypothetical protein
MTLELVEYWLHVVVFILVGVVGWLASFLISAISEHSKEIDELKGRQNERDQES